MGRRQSPETPYEKAKRKERAVLLVERKGIDVEQAFSACGFRISRYSYPRILACYRARGVEGLLETRGGRRSVKITEDIKKFIRSIKEERKGLSAREICQILKKRFSVEVHFSYMSRILLEMGLNNPVGRPAREQIVEHEGIDHAGCFVLKAACVAMNVSQTVTDVILKRIRELRGVRSGDGEQLGTLRIVSSSAQVIRRKIETLLFMPAFGMERIWHFKTVYPRKGLGLVTGSGTPYKYHTMDNFLRELPLLDIDQQLSKSLAKLYVESFHINFRTKDSRTFYIDCFRKVVWTKKNIPKGMHATRNQILKCMDVYFIHDSQGRPLLPLTRPGDSYLGEALFPIIEALEEAIGRKVVDFAIFDREGLAVSVFKEFERRSKHFVTVLRENQYRSVEDFQIPKGSRWKAYKRDPQTGKVREQILDWNKGLTDSKNRKSYRVRTILVREVGSESFAVVVTNITRRIEPEGAKIVRKYKDRWENQENSFKQMKPSLYLDTNHGTNAIEQKTNRVVTRRVEELKKKIEAQNKRLQSIRKKIRKTEETLRRLGESIRSAAGNSNDSVRRDKRIVHREKIKSTLDLQQKLLAECEAKLGGLTKKLEGIDQTQLLYEIDSRKDHIMTNLETALNNADVFVKEHYLPAQYKRSDFRTIRDALYRQQGTYRETAEEVMITLDRYDQEPEHQMIAEHVSQKINDAQLALDSGKRLTVRVATA